MVRMRVPEAARATVQGLLADAKFRNALRPRPIQPQGVVRIPYFAVHVPAGFPSPAEQYLEDELDLNQHLIPFGHEASTYLIRVSGWSMVGAGIYDGDELVVDRAEEQPVGKVVVAVHNGGMTIKRLRMREGHPVLVAENPDYPDRIIAEGDDFSIWGVVVRVLHTP